MNIEYYRNFVSIVEEGSILGAAKKQIIAQPALSAQVKRMEREFGTVLLRRGAHGVELTDAGKILYQKAKYMIELEDSTRTEIKNSETGCEGILSLALPSANSEKFLRELLGTFMEKYPRVQLQIHESDSLEVADCVASGIAEIGFIKTPIEGAYRFHFFSKKFTTIAAIYPRELEGNIPEKVTLKSLNGKKLIMPKGCLTSVKAALQSAECTADIIGDTTTRNAAIVIAKMKGCIALVPYDPEETKREDIVIRKITDKEIRIPRQLIVKKDVPLSKIGMNFLKEQQIADKYLNRL
ncbi:MAG: LysR family transcriptional regulator [Lachnospiraceae bacterium]|nr:LysR family transcriptional regulator [Lachnospiraceae bacterium]